MKEPCHAVNGKEATEPLGDWWGARPSVLNVRARAHCCMSYTRDMTSITPRDRPQSSRSRPPSPFRVVEPMGSGHVDLGGGRQLSDAAAQRSVRYLRLSVTDRCNLRCRYCMPEEGVEFVSKTQVLSFEEITRIVRCFVALGVDHIKLTGGEPLLRRDLASLVSALTALDGVVDVSMTTNGLGLARAATALREAGLSRVNLSLDTLSRARFTALTRRDRLPQVLAGLAALKDAGFQRTKLNVVVIGGQNCDELAALVDFGIRHQLVVRFIEYMPIGLDHHWSKATFVPIEAMLERLATAFDVGEASGFGAASGVVGAGPARYRLLTRRSDGVVAKVGFITALSEHFCGACNRVRLTAQGTLQECLAVPGRRSLRDHIRQGGSDTDLLALIRDGVWGKHPGHDFKVDGGGKRVYQPMSVTGG